MYGNSQQFLATFTKVYIDYVLILTKTGLGYILGDFFTNSSGHTGCNKIKTKVFENWIGWPYRRRGTEEDEDDRLKKVGEGKKQRSGFDVVIANFTILLSGNDVVIDFS
jgi:hypothetical protein